MNFNLGQGKLMQASVLLYEKLASKDTILHRKLN